jgi:glycerol-3-phosphate acyltransferase PlsY
MGTVLLILGLSYLVGSIPASVWAGQLFESVDVREHGSGNAGATNTFRVVGWKAGLVAMVVDLGKGVAAAGVVPFLVGMEGLPRWGLVPWEAQTVLCIAAGLAAVVGHIFPLWAGFRGGKGVNTSAGVLLALTPQTMLMVLGLFLVVLLVSRYVSLASMTAAIAFPSAVAVRRYLFGIDRLDPSLLFFGLFLCVAVLVAHRSNIQRLLRGNENRISSFRPAEGMAGRGEV